MGKNANSGKGKKSEGNSRGGFWADFKEIGVTFVEGDWKTRVSYLIMGFGPLLRKQFLRGIAFLAVEASLELDTFAVFFR